MNKCLMAVAAALYVGLLPVKTYAQWETVIPGDSMTPTNFDTYWEWFYPWGQTHNGSAKMYQEQVTLTTIGETTIEAVTPDPYGSTYKYASGSFNSRAWVTVDHCYPEWEIKGEFKAPIVKGSWPAFWITGAFSWPPEVDILEFKGDAYNWFNTYDGAWETEKVWVADAPSVWHEYRCVMTMADPGGVTGNPNDDDDVYVDFYLDGVWKARHTGSGFVGQPFNIIVNLQMEGSSGSPGPTDPTYYHARNIVLQRKIGALPAGAPTPPVLAVAFPINGAVCLDWEPSPECDVSHYNLYSSTTPGGPYTLIASMMSLHYDHTGLVNGTTYYYVVTAVDQDGNESAASNELFATPSAALSAGKTTTASSYQSGNEPFDGNDDNCSTRWTASGNSYPQWWKVDLGSVQSINKADIYWYASPYRSYKYKIETSEDDVNYTTVVDQTQRTSTGATYDSFSASARYVRVTVTGVEPSGGWAAFWECRIFAGSGTSQPPAAPSNLQATAKGKTQIDLAWTDNSSNESSFEIERSTDNATFVKIAEVGSNVTTYSDAGLASKTTYYYRVRACSSDGCSAYSNTASATTK